MKQISIELAAMRIAQALPGDGAFLCVGGKRPNPMTIGWGGLTYFWGKHVFLAPVRPQRFTHPLLEQEGEFTVCVPAPGEMRKALAQAGTLSGRDGDKFAAIGLETLPGRAVNAPVIRGCALYLECRVLARTAFTGEGTDDEVAARAYPQGDFHTLFFGEVIACYAGENV